ncbi:hypothetical protein RvY_03385-1 [Ramazzottius varieornatus]|uniref:Uncharacterized protein n=1 Tax=Ramazzottius varieornatus TaxID=947166 RepID=A0A1D1UMV2_RAMVA|nr:hypothetical protein RvY_03385-1 [Ramazzottius varieornatus]
MPPKVSKSKKKEDGRLAATMGVIQEVRDLLKPSNIRQVQKELKVNNRRRQPSTSSCDSSSGSDSDSDLDSHSSDCTTCSSACHSTDCSTCSHSTDCSTCSDSYSPLRNPRPIKRKTKARVPCAKPAAKKSTTKKSNGKGKSTKGKENECKKTETREKATNCAVKSTSFATSTPKKKPACCASGREEWTVSKIYSADRYVCDSTRHRESSPARPTCCCQARCAAATSRALLLPSTRHEPQAPKHSRDEHRLGSWMAALQKRPSSHRPSGRPNRNSHSPSQNRLEAIQSLEKQQWKQKEGWLGKELRDQRGSRSAQRPHRSLHHSNAVTSSNAHLGLATGIAGFLPVIKKAMTSPATLQLQDALVAVNSSKAIYDGVMQSWSAVK